MTNRLRLELAKEPNAGTWEFAIAPGRPLSFAQPLEAAGPRALAGALRSHASTQLYGRVPVAVSSTEVDATRQRLRAVEGSNGGDPCWVEVDATREPRTVFFLSQSQLVRLRARGGCRELELPNAQIVQVIWTGDGSESNGPLPYGEQLLRLDGTTLGPAGDETVVLQATASSVFAGDVPSQNAFYAVVHGSHRELLGSGFCIVANPFLEEELAGIALRFAVEVFYSDRIAPERVALDDTVLLAVGARPGEPCELTRARRGRIDHFLSRRIFGYRHAVCRVTTATTTDQEKPLVRLPLDVFDVIGVCSDSNVVIEGVAGAASTRPGIRRKRFRALEIRADGLATVPLRLRGGGPNFLDLVGSIDLPPVAMDKVRRDAIGVTADSPVYVRPALGSLLARELSSVTLLLGAGVIGSLSASEVTLTIILVIAYLLVVAIATLRRLR